MPHWMFFGWTPVEGVLFHGAIKIYDDKKDFINGESFLFRKLYLMDAEMKYL